MPNIQKIFQNNAFPRMFSQTSIDKDGQFLQNDQFSLENSQNPFLKPSLIRTTSLTWRIDGSPSQDIFGSMQFIDILKELVVETKQFNDEYTLLILTNEPSPKDYIQTLFPKAVTVCAISMDEFKSFGTTTFGSQETENPSSKMVSQVVKSGMDIESEMIMPEKLCRSCNVSNENYNSFCYNCGLFLPSTMAKAKREHIYRENSTSDPLIMYERMKDKQNINRTYNPIKSYVSLRSVLIDKIAKLVKGLNYESKDSKQPVNPTKLSKKEEVHLAVAYMDAFYAKNEPVSFQQMEIVATLCVILSIKFCNDLSRDLKEYYEALKMEEKYEVSYADFLLIESWIVQALDWEVWIRTPFEFLHFYLSRGVIFDSDKFGSVKLDEEFLQSLRLMAEGALEDSLHDYSNNQYTSHMVGAAAVACARKGLGIAPIWSNELEELTNINWSELEPLYRNIYEGIETRNSDKSGFYKKSNTK